MEKMWECIQDEQLRPDILKVIIEVNFPVNSPELEFFLAKIKEMSPSIMCEEVIDIVCNTKKQTENFPNEIFNYSEILSKIIIRQDYSLNIREKALTSYAEMLNELPFEPYKKNILDKCVHEMLTKVYLIY